MKKLFWILLIVNSIAFVYFKSDVWAPSPMSSQSELNPQQLRVIQEDALASLPPRKSPLASENLSAEATDTVASAAAASELATNAEAAHTEKHCYEWGDFVSANVNQAIDALTTLGLHHDVMALQAGNDNKRYWIYKPPLASAEAAQVKAEELHRLGVDDFFIVQAPKWQNAISFGVFKDEKLADALMEKLKQKGVRLLVKAPRFGGEGQAMLKLHAVTKSQYDALKKIQPQFPDAELKEVVCK